MSDQNQQGSWRELSVAIAIVIVLVVCAALEALGIPVVSNILTIVIGGAE